MGVVRSLFRRARSYAAAGPLLGMMWVALATLYVVTDRRILVIEPLPSESVQWMSKQEVVDVHLQLSTDGTGDLVFRREPTSFEQVFVPRAMNGESDAEPAAQPATTTSSNVPDPGRVLDLVRSAYQLRERS